MNPRADDPVNSIKLVLFGNAILDIGKRLSDTELHQKYNLKLDDQLEPGPDILNAIKRDLKEFGGQSHITSGGSCLNSCKILNQLGETRTIFCGGIGSDENGKMLEELLDKNNIQRRLQRLDNFATALCICLIHKESRCLLAHIGASTHFNSVEVVDELAGLCSSSTLCYIEGYFIPQKMSICKLIFERFCVEQRAQLVLNLNATYIVDQHPVDVIWLFKRSHLVFGNRREFDALLRVAKKESVSQLLLETAAEDNLMAEQQTTSRICVITDGAKSVQYVRCASNRKDGIHVGWLAVPKVGENLVVDTTGAGDAFVAGFLYLYLKRDRRPVEEISLEDCIRHGVEVAQRKLAYLGCTLVAGEEEEQRE